LALFRYQKGSVGGDGELDDKVAKPNSHEESMEYIRPEWDSSLSLLLVHHPNATREKEHVDHTAKAPSVADYVPDLVIKHRAEASKSNDEKIDHKNIWVSGPFGLHEN